MAASNGSRGGMAAGMLLAGTVSLLALPSAVLAFNSGFEPKLIKAENGERSSEFQASKLLARLAPALPLSSLGKGQMFHFTPAGTANVSELSPLEIVLLANTCSPASDQSPS